MLLTGSGGEDEVLLADGRGSWARLSCLGGGRRSPQLQALLRADVQTKEAGGCPSLQGTQDHREPRFLTAH